MERRILDTEVRLAEKEGQPTVIHGVAARFYDGTPDTEYRFKVGKQTIVERIAPGAFNRAVTEDNVAALFNHDPNIVLGRTSSGTLKLSVDGVGLRYEIDPPSSAAGVMESIKRGDVSGSSFAFQPRVGGQTWRDAEINNEKVTIRELTDVRLYDVSAVTYPAYSGASVAVRAFDPEALEKEINEWRSTQAADALNTDDAKRQRAMRARVVEIS